MLKYSNAIIAFWILSIILSVVYLSTYANINTSIISIFSGGTSTSQNNEITQALLDSPNRIIFGSIEGVDEQKLAEYSKIFIKSLRETKQFDFVTNGSLLPAIDSDNPLFPYRYILSESNGNRQFDTAYIKKSFQAAYRTLRSPFSLANKDILSRDPTNSWMRYLKSYLSNDQPDIHEGVWFSKDRTRALFLLALNKNSSHIEHSEKQINQIKQLFKIIPDKDDANVLLTLSGSAIFAINSRNSIRSETKKLSILATVAVILILLFAYKSLSLVILSAIPVITAILIAATCVGIYFGSIHGITLAFGSTLLGVVIDYPIHLFSHIKNNKSISYSVEYCWPTIRLGMITTVVAYSAMAFADFAGLAQLGLFAIVGIIAGATTTRWVVPILISTRLNIKRFSISEATTRNLSNPNKSFAIIGISISIFIIILAMLYNDGNILQSDLKQFSSVPESSIKQYARLKEDLHIPETADVIFVSANNPETALQKTEEITQALSPLLENGGLLSFDAASRYLPSKKTQMERQNSLPNPNILSTSVDEAMAGMNFKENYFQSFINDIVSSKSIRPLSPLDALAEPGSLLGNKLSSLLFQQGDKWLSFIPINGVKDEAQILLAIDRLPTKEGVRTQYVNSHNKLALLMDQYLTETVKRIMVGSVILLVILGIGLTNLKQLLRVILPITLGVTVTSAILILIEGGLSLFHIVALLLTVGISIDYALFLSRDKRNISEHQNTLTSIIICALSTIAVFGILGSSDIPVLQAIGKTVSIGVVVAFILSVLLSQPHIRQVNDSKNV